MGPIRLIGPIRPILFLRPIRFLELRMADASTWILTDVASETYVRSFELHPHDVPGSPGGWWVTKETLHGGLRDGVDLIGLCNGPLTFWVIPTRGMGLWKGQMRSTPSRKPPCNVSLV